MLKALPEEEVIILNPEPHSMLKALSEEELIIVCRACIHTHEQAQAHTLAFVFIYTYKLYIHIYQKRKPEMQQTFGFRLLRAVHTQYSFLCVSV
jgi:hypothetical protein